MGGENQDTERASKEVTVVVNIRIRPGCEKDYDEWLGRFLTLERKVPGYLGVVLTQIGYIFDYRHGLHFAACYCAYCGCN